MNWYGCVNCVTLSTYIGLFTCSAFNSQQHQSGENDDCAFEHSRSNNLEGRGLESFVSVWTLFSYPLTKSPNTLQNQKREPRASSANVVLSHDQMVTLDNNTVKSNPVQSVRTPHHRFYLMSTVFHVFYARDLNKRPKRQRKSPLPLCRQTRLIHSHFLKCSIVISRSALKHQDFPSQGSEI